MSHLQKAIFAKPISTLFLKDGKGKKEDNNNGRNKRAKKGIREEKEDKARVSIYFFFG